MSKEEIEKPEPLRTDKKAPEYLTITVTDPDGKVWAKEIAKPKHFTTGSVGFYMGGKIPNPENGERYQTGCNMILVGSKPPKEQLKLMELYYDRTA